MTISTSEAIRKKAHDLGFDVCRFTEVETAWPASARLAEFVADGRHGDMGWMAETLERRSHPRAMWPAARSAVVLGMNYGPQHDPLTLLDHPTRGAISVYAQGDDYHELIKGRLKQLASFMASQGEAELKVFVDTAPLMEKPLAERAGLGWQGKHTNLVSRDFGSWLFLGVILTELALPPDPKGEDHCGQCHACLDACPTKAFPAPYQLDARRCISYLTIELKGPIPAEFRPALGNRIYGCDDCLAVCPWNKFASDAREKRLHARQALKEPRLSDLVQLDDPTFRMLFAKGPVKRIGRDRFIRNVLYAIGNSGDRGATVVVEPLLDDPDPVVRGAAIWALSRLMSPEAFAALGQARAADEPDAQTRAEWDLDQAATAS